MCCWPLCVSASHRGVGQGKGFLFTAATYPAKVWVLLVRKGREWCRQQHPQPYFLSPLLPAQLCLVSLTFLWGACSLRRGSGSLKVSDCPLHFLFPASWETCLQCYLRLFNSDSCWLLTWLGLYFVSSPSSRQLDFQLSLLYSLFTFYKILLKPLVFCCALSYSFYPCAFTSF